MLFSSHVVHCIPMNLLPHHCLRSLINSLFPVFTLCNARSVNASRLSATALASACFVVFYIIITRSSHVSPPITNVFVLQTYPVHVGSTRSPTQ
ncbi:hypothetical protein BS47DRAFT_637640 [Hydnum rufescens UP504]|uniref:Uncharacterized protein n=1 Tax=Hydnum rufescens UP504 TaxID=1448309 RepID=A0A9P6E269_9AGAM|nr:hypothetical protein BS47DRAFT_637640 [Hydnum rufescens UP504]